MLPAFSNFASSYDAEKAVMNELTKKLEEEQELYETLMAEREEERMRLFEEDAYNFLLNRSARRIQRAWRDFVDRKKARKRAKLGITSDSLDFLATLTSILFRESQAEETESVGEGREESSRISERRRKEGKRKGQVEEGQGGES